MSLLPISVVVNTLNEEKYIVKCLDSVQDIAEEIIVCDMYSDDSTVELSKSFSNTTIIFHPKLTFVEPARHFAISKATKEWVLVLDADEYLTEELKGRLREIFRSLGSLDLIRVGKLYNYFGKYIKHGGFYKYNYPLIFRRELFMESYTEKNSEIFKGYLGVTSASKSSIIAGKQYYVMHDAYPDVEKFISKTVSKYAFIEARDLERSGVKFNVTKLIVKPLFIFLKKYILQFGFLDGWHGFVLCCLYSQYVFNVNANLWFLDKKEGNK